MSGLPVLCMSENASMSRVSLSTSVSGLTETSFDIILIKQARLAQPTAFIVAFGLKARLTDSKDLYCVREVESQDGLPTTLILTL
jgi:hypothetical protein